MDKIDKMDNETFLLNFGNFQNKEKKLSFKKIDKIVKNLSDENTLKHIFRYQTLYKIMNRLYFATIDNPLECLIYYKEDDGFFAEIQNTWHFDIKERVIRHLHLLRCIRRNVELRHVKVPKAVCDDDEPILAFEQWHI